jgi:hypothetical protein
MPEFRISYSLNIMFLRYHHGAGRGFTVDHFRTLIQTLANQEGLTPKQLVKNRWEDCARKQVRNLKRYKWKAHACAGMENFQLYVFNLTMKAMGETWNTGDIRDLLAATEQEQPEDVHTYSKTLNSKLFCTQCHCVQCNMY